MNSESFDTLASDRDYSDFFRTPELVANYPELVLPPASFRESGAKILSFRSGETITLAFPIHERQTNPIGTLQGGVLCSFFDDAMGVLAFASLRRPCVSISLSVDFIRATRPGDHLRISAEFISKGRDVVHLRAEASDSRGKLVAIAMTSMKVLGS